MTVTHTRTADADAPGGRRAAVRLAVLAVPTGVAMVAAVFAAGPANAADNTGNAIPITGYGGLCLDDQGAGTANFNPVQMYGCNSTDAQKWFMDTDGSTIRALGKCLDVQYGGTSDGTPVELYDCNGTGAQVWLPQSNGSFYNPQSNKCLDDTNWSTTAGTQAQIWDCTGECSQEWSAASTWLESTYPAHPALGRQE